jgi:hypothetical protein
MLATYFCNFQKTVHSRYIHKQSAMGENSSTLVTLALKCNAKKVQMGVLDYHFLFHFYSISK